MRTLSDRLRDDAGVALIMVIGWTLVLGTLISAGVAYAMQSNVTAHRSQDWGSALGAAQAGIEDYVARLNRNDNYGRTWDCTNNALKGPKATGNTCSWTSSTPTGWIPVVSTQPTGPAFHYDVDASKLDLNGTILVRSTGRSGTVTRTVEVAIGRGGSTDFLYYTDFEDADPTNTTVYPNQPGDGYVECGSTGAATASYAWQSGTTRNTNGSNCMEITFASGDVLNGRVHFNDLPLAATGAQFVNGFETAAPACKTATAPNYDACLRSYAGNPTFGTPASGGNPAVVVPPTYSDPLALDDTSAKFATYPGCHYYGATRIKFGYDVNGNVALGKMAVWSKDSAGKSTGTNCGTFSSTTSPAYAQTVDVPTDQVIYVSGTGSVHECVAKEIDGTLPLGTFAGSQTATYTYDVTMATTDQYCGQGNAYIEGVVKGRVSIAAENSIVLTGDLLISSGTAGTDIIGLVAGNSVEVYHPWVDTWQKSNGVWGWKGSGQAQSGWPTRYNDPSNGNTPFPASGIQIDASIQTLQHSFWVQQYSQGSAQGTLLVLGSIAQRWRGIVGQNGGSSHGYLKSYQYDSRLKWSSPPYFPQWTNAKWGARHTGEMTPTYNAAGAYTGP
jgi:Tfp pilus assembly protein PilX